MAYDTMDKTSIMSKANEDNGSESGENDGVEGDDTKDNNDVVDKSIEDLQNEDNGESINEEDISETDHNTSNIDEEDEHEKSNDVDSDPVHSPMSADKMPHRMEKSQSPKELVKTGTKRERTGVSPSKSSSSRPETPPLKRLMRQDPLPLFVQKRQHSPIKKLAKEGFYPHKFHIPPMALSAMSVIKNAPTHPKQTMSKSKMYSNKLPKSFHSVYPLSSSSFSSLTPPSSSSSHHTSSTSSAMPRTHSEDQPLDLSKKTGSKNEHYRGESDHSSSHSKATNGHLSSGVQSTLQSLQQRFGGNLHMRSLRKPLCGLLPVMPEVLSKSRSPIHHHNSHSISSSSSLHQISKKPHQRSPGNASPPHHSTSKLDKVDNSPSRSNPEKEIQEESNRCDTDLNSNLTLKNEVNEDTDNEDNKYTMHRCTCQKTYNSLYALSLHLQETGHLPSGSKQTNLMEYPKLVRGQDMWLNQESEHTKRILRCMQCGESFKSLPMLTVHMMQTQHYTKIVSSEHGRRSHKCSAYCDRETDRECIFKCKVCNSTFTDMEGLANHMILSGHHKKNILRSHNYLSEFAFRGRRKRMFSGEDALDGVGNMSTLLDYKRKCLSLSTPPPINGHPRYADSPDSESAEDSTISCENCGDRIETNNFVEHVRLCLRSRPASLDKVRLSLYKDEVASIKSEKSQGSQGDLEEMDDENISMFENPVDSEEDTEVKMEVKEEDCTSGGEDAINENKTSIKSKVNDEPSEILNFTHLKDKKRIKLESSDKSENEVEEGNLEEYGEKEIQKDKIIREKCVKSPSGLDFTSKIKEEDKESIEEGEVTQYPKLSQVLKTEDKNSHKKSDPDNDNSLSFAKVIKHDEFVKKLDIINPERTMEEDNSENSALQAMESFIQKSFSSKFNYRRGNMVFSSGERSLLKPTLHQTEARESRHNSLYRFEKYKKYFQQDEQHNGSMKKSLSEAAESLKMCMPMSASGSSAKDDLKKLEKLCESVKKSNSPISESDENKKSASGFSMERPPSGSSENGEILASKYLNYESDSEVEENKNKASSSALDSLSSFVYGQPLNSEHPLDSLQKLITKTDIPKLLASQSMKYFQRCSDSPEVSLPLNLSLKKGGEVEDCEGLDREMFSDHEGSESDSDANVEYRCAACSRHFASKGSYRYHLSRCHLSSVKKYGIKEAFNMSPYVYLPLDHTAKFSKYYEMAHELASKGK